MLGSVVPGMCVCMPYTKLTSTMLLGEGFRTCHSGSAVSLIQLQYRFVSCCTSPLEDHLGPCSKFRRGIHNTAVCLVCTPSALAVTLVHLPHRCVSTVGRLGQGSKFFCGVHCALCVHRRSFDVHTECCFQPLRLGFVRTRQPPPPADCVPSVPGVSCSVAACALQCNINLC